MSIWSQHKLDLSVDAVHDRAFHAGDRKKSVPVMPYVCGAQRKGSNARTLILLLRTWLVLLSKSAYLRGSQPGHCHQTFDSER
jgi:hypothetical protein